MTSIFGYDNRGKADITLLLHHFCADYRNASEEKVKLEAPELVYNIEK